MTAVMQGALKL